MPDGDSALSVSRFAFELLFRSTPNDQHKGSGFAIAHAGRTWLITCAHNFERDFKNLRGCLDYPLVEFVQPSGLTINAGDGRRIVFAKIGGEFADCVAMELALHELPGGTCVLPIDLPVFGEAIADDHEDQVEICDSEGETVSVKREGLFLIVGFSNRTTQAGPVTIVASHGVVGLDAWKSFMIAYAPSVPDGCSGGPVLRAVSPGSYLPTAIHTNTRNTTVPIPIDGRVCSLPLSYGLAVPLKIILHAIGAASGKGLQVIQVGD